MENIRQSWGGRNFCPTFSFQKFKSFRCLLVEEISAVRFENMMRIDKRCYLSQNTFHDVGINVIWPDVLVVAIYNVDNYHMLHGFTQL